MNLNLLDSKRINKIVRSLEDELAASEPLTFLNRVGKQDVYDNRDITVTYSGQVVAADIVMNDATARIVENGTLTVEQALSYVPNIKTGRRLNQNDLELYRRIEQGLQYAIGDPKSELLNFELSIARDLVLGVRQTMNLVCGAMYSDTLSYDRFGMDVGAQVSFGMPADLKTALIGTDQWTSGNLATFDAIDDVQTLANYARVTYGKVYNRVDMSTAKFQLILQSTKFRDRVKQWMGLEATSTIALSANDLIQGKNLFEAISGMTLNLEDTFVKVQSSDGSILTPQRVIADDTVILSSTADDNDLSVMDFAQGVPDELTVKKLAGESLSVSFDQRGILSYYTTSDNPPSLSTWAVVKGWGRKHDKYFSAILTVE